MTKIRFYLYICFKIENVLKFRTFYLKTVSVQPAKVLYSFIKFIYNSKILLGSRNKSFTGSWKSKIKSFFPLKILIGRIFYWSNIIFKPIFVTVVISKFYLHCFLIMFFEYLCQKIMCGLSSFWFSGLRRIFDIKYKIQSFIKSKKFLFNVISQQNIFNVSFFLLETFKNLWYDKEKMKM